MAHDNAGDGDMHSRSRPGQQPFPGPREIRYLLELTLAYARGLKDVIEVISDAVVEHPDLMARYVTLLDRLRDLSHDGLGSIERECRALLGEV